MQQMDGAVTTVNSAARGNPTSALSPRTADPRETECGHAHGNRRNTHAPISKESEKVKQELHFACRESAAPPDAG